ncbi:MAG TPA: ribose-phosphate diphosphokinase [Chloroflexota bacterium]
MEARLQIFSGSSNDRLTSEVTEFLGIPRGRASIGLYEDGETKVRLEEHVRGSDVYVIQSLCSPVDHHIMELLLIVDAVRRCSASRVTAVVPYLAYAKQEKKTAGLREPISAKLIANILATAGVDRLLTVDLHSAAIEGFFDIPVDHLRIHGTFAGYFEKLDLCEDVVVVSPDTGGVARANELRERLGASLAIIYRQGPGRRDGGTLEMVGDVKGKCAIVVDDMITTGRTLVSAAEELLRKGAARVYACATHGVFTEEALDVIEKSPIERVVVTNTVPLPGRSIEKLDVISVGPLISESILRIHKDISLSSLFN